MTLLDSVRSHCTDLAPALVERHFRRMPSSYFDRYSAADIAHHLRLLAGLDGANAVQVEIRSLAGHAYDLSETPSYGPWREFFAFVPRDAALPALPTAVLPPERDGAASIAEALDRGHAVIELDGEKLHGRWALTRVADDRWILVKARDAFAERGRDIVAEQPGSVVSGRTLDEVSRGPR